MYLKKAMVKNIVSPKMTFPIRKLTILIYIVGILNYNIRLYIDHLF